MKFKNLTQVDKDEIVRRYKSKEPRESLQKDLATKHGVIPRTIRKWAKELQVGLMNPVVPSYKIMVYDIETSRVRADVWWTGKQYIGHHQLKEEPRIITVAYKWLGEDEVHHLTWSKKQCDKKLMKKFLQQYNQADMVIGQNNDRFDNRWINARALKHGLYVNVHVKSFDIMKQAKRLLRIPSYSMAYMAKYLDVTLKQSHEGIKMWEMIQYGNKAQRKEYLKKMVDYNVGDIVSTEELYFKMRPYMGHIVHFGVLKGAPKYTCPNCGGSNIKLDRTVVTPAGTIQRVMQCKDDGVQFKISNKQYMNFLDDRMKNK